MWQALAGWAMNKLANKNEQGNNIADNLSSNLAPDQQNGGFGQLDWGLDKLPSQQYGGFGNFGGF